jgi:uncharacterized membrane protein
VARLNQRNREERRLENKLARALQNNVQVAPGARLTVEQMTTGPIPSAAEMQGYERAHAGLADRIVKMAEDEASHRRQLESTIATAQTRDILSGRLESRIGQLLAFGIATTIVVCGTVCILYGHEISGTALSGGTLASLVGIFIYGRHGRPSSGKPQEPAKTEMQKTDDRS